MNTNLQTSYLQVQRGDADYDASGLPPAAHAELTRKYGINRGATSCTRAWRSTTSH